MNESKVGGTVTLVEIRQRPDDAQWVAKYRIGDHFSGTVTGGPDFVLAKLARLAAAYPAGCSQ